MTIDMGSKAEIHGMSKIDAALRYTMRAATPHWMIAFLLHNNRDSARLNVLCPALKSYSAILQIVLDFLSAGCYTQRQSEMIRETNMYICMEQN
jgi:hypothetical protein